MKAYAVGFLLAGLASACFIDSGVKLEVARLGKIAVAILTVLFAVAEGMVIFGT